MLSRLRRISRLMVSNLEIQEVMDCVKSVVIRRRDANPSACGQLLKGVRDVGPPVLHLGDAGRGLAMDEHRNGEVTVGEHRRDVFQVHPNHPQILNVLGIVDRDLNRSAVRQEPKVMGRLVMRESHRHVAVLLNVGLMLGLGLLVHRTGLHVLCC